MHLPDFMLFGVSPGQSYLSGYLIDFDNLHQVSSRNSNTNINFLWKTFLETVLTFSILFAILFTITAVPTEVLSVLNTQKKLLALTWIDLVSLEEYSKADGVCVCVCVCIPAVTAQRLQCDEN